MNSLNIEKFFHIPSLLHAGQFQQKSVLAMIGPELKAWLQQLLLAQGCKDASPLVKTAHCSPHAYLEGQVFIDEGAIIEPTAYIKGPCYIGPGTEVRHGAYIRGNVYIGAHCVVGHTTEVKGSVFLDHAKAGHFAYVGDSVLGQHANLGAGTKIANLKLTQDEVSFQDPDSGRRIASGLKKFGAILGDRVQTGCNSVISPGSLLFPKTMVMSSHHFHGTLTKGIAR